MQMNEIENNPELQQVLWACYDYWKNEDMPIEERVICYSFVKDPYKKRFGKMFHQSKLSKLANLGFLERDRKTRGGNRRYYKLVNPDRVVVLLRKWDLI